MKIGIPGGLLYYRYKDFIDTFVEELGAERIYSLHSSKKILDKGIEDCVDEACLPIKIFNGHVKELSEKADAIIVPRIMQCEFGESICPKFSGLPELSKRSAGEAKLAFSHPLHINDRRLFVKSMVKGGRELGFSSKKIKEAVKKAESVQAVKELGINEDEFSYKVLLSGHAYNIYDEFVNMNIIKKLHDMGVGIITEEAIKKDTSINAFSELIKEPYWLYFRNNYEAAKHAMNQSKIQGIIYLSSFNCGIDSIVVEIIKNTVGDFPMLVLKLDEQSGEAGMNTRLLAFCEMIERKEREKEGEGA